MPEVVTYRNIFVPKVTSLGLVQLTVKSVRPVHSRKALWPMDSTLLGIVIEVKLVQSMKAYFPTLVTPVGIIIELREVHSLKAYSPMLVNVLGRIIELRFPHSPNTDELIVSKVLPEANVTVVKEVHL